MSSRKISLYDDFFSISVSITQESDVTITFILKAWQKCWERLGIHDWLLWDECRYSAEFLHNYWLDIFFETYSLDFSIMYQKLSYHCATTLLKCTPSLLIIFRVFNWIQLFSRRGILQIKLIRFQRSWRSLCVKFWLSQCSCRLNLKCSMQ